MKITVRLFSHLVKYLPDPEIRIDTVELDVPSDATVATVIGLICIPHDVRRTITVNDKNCGEDRRLLKGDVVKVFPIAMGG